MDRKYRTANPLAASRLFILASIDSDVADLKCFSPESGRPKPSNRITDAFGFSPVPDATPAAAQQPREKQRVKVGTKDSI
jgi:hypothetical protein